jgi:hypothetical protein
MLEAAPLTFLPLLAYRSLKVEAVLLNFSREILLLSVKSEPLSASAAEVVGDKMDSRREPPNLPRLGDQKR